MSFKRRHLSANTRLRDLEPVLRKWHLLVDQIATDWSEDEDCPWWYTERASVGLLAAAAWKAHWTAFEAYSAEKGRSAAAYTGRCDLYLGNDEYEYVAEAKQIWTSAGTRARKTAKQIEQGLYKSYKDAKSNKRKKEVALGILFAVPLIPNAERGRIQQCLATWTERVLSVRADCHAWIFPKVAQELPPQDGYLYPGIALLIKRVGRKGR